MATYKVLQDIEAEDHILGPLTLRQFIFGMIAAFMFYICGISVIKHWYPITVIFLLPALFFGFFALPFGRDQPTEIWFLAKLRFWFKPRRRVWNQSGVKELVTITVPKKVERVLTNGLSQNEVKSRLSALAQTLDSRGWAVKHASNAGAAYAPPPMAVVGGSDDRLLGLDSLPQEVPAIDAVAPEDMLDETTSPLARQFDSMMTQSSQAHRQQLMTQLNSIQTGQGMAPAAPMPQVAGNPGRWFMAHTATADSPVMEPVVSGSVPSAEDDSALADRLAAQARSKQVSFGNLRTMRPLGSTMPAVPPTPPATPMPVMPDPAILSLASSNDLNVATLARQAKRNKGGDGSSDEVVISLH